VLELDQNAAERLTGIRLLWPCWCILKFC